MKFSFTKKNIIIIITIIIVIILAITLPLVLIKSNKPTILPSTTLAKLSSKSDTQFITIGTQKTMDGVIYPTPWPEFKISKFYYYSNSRATSSLLTIDAFTLYGRFEFIPNTNKGVTKIIYGWKFQGVEEQINDIGISNIDEKTVLTEFSFPKFKSSSLDLSINTAEPTTSFVLGLYFRMNTDSRFDITINVPQTVKATLTYTYS